MREGVSCFSCRAAGHIHPPCIGPDETDKIMATYVLRNAGKFGKPVVCLVAFGVAARLSLAFAPERELPGRTSEDRRRKREDEEVDVVEQRVIASALDNLLRLFRHEVAGVPAGTAPVTTRRLPPNPASDEIEEHLQRSRSRAPASEVADTSSRSPAATFSPESSCRPSRIDFFCDETRAGSYDYATNWTHKRVKKGHVPLLKKYARGNCLEVAAGTGGFLKYYEFFGRGGDGERGRDGSETEKAGEGGVSHLVLFDSSAPMLKRAHLRAVGLGIPPEKITLKRGDVNELKMLMAGRQQQLHEHDEDEQLEVFDTVIDVLGLCSYDDPQEAVRQMFSVLRPGGCLILSEHGESDWELIRHAQRRFWEKNMRECGCDSTLDMFALVEKALATSKTSGSCTTTQAGVVTDIGKSKKTSSKHNHDARTARHDSCPAHAECSERGKVDDEPAADEPAYEVVEKIRRSFGAYYHLVLRKKG